METSAQTPERLLDYLILVGPGHGVTFEPVKSPSRTRNVQGWHNITTPHSTILKQYPARDHPDCELAREVVYFCQPEGCCVEISAPKTHVFMLTDTETNLRTYGVCLSIPHLFDPQPPTAAAGAKRNLVKSEAISIQEWGVLSICILSHHSFFGFFAKCLKTLSHFVEHFGSNKFTWNDLLQVHSGPGISSGTTTAGKEQLKESRFVIEIERWIDNLLSLPAPEVGRCGLEVELEVEPEVLVSYPQRSRLPLYDLHVHQMLRRIGVHTLIEIFKLVLSEQKVILHSCDPAFVSECVMGVVTLLYPLQYLYPVIPLLPTIMPTAENLLMVPTPYLIGVADTFMKKVQNFQIAETWVVGLDTKQIKPPQVLDQPLLDFPLSILQLQADIRKVLDKVHEIRDLTDGNLQSSSARPVTISQDNSRHSSPTFALVTPTPTPTLGEEHPDHNLFNEVDVEIRVAFVQFLFDSELLGYIDQHLCVYRLFPRPVVALRSSAFLAAYRSLVSTTDTRFIERLIKTQCVEYFFQYCVNPTNFAFEEIKRGITETKRLTDKPPPCHASMKTSQVSLYSHSPDSLLYQEMLAHKAAATQGRDVSLDDSDWEVLSGDNYDGDSEASSVSYFSDLGNDLTPVALRPVLGIKTGGVSVLTQQNGSVGVSLEEVEVGYHAPRLLTRGSDEVDDGVEPEAGDKKTMENVNSNNKDVVHDKGGVVHPSSPPITPKVSILQQTKASSSEHLSLSVQSEESRSYLTPGCVEETYLTPHTQDMESSASDVETEFRQRHSAKTRELRRHHSQGTGDHRGEAPGDHRGAGNSPAEASNWKQNSLRDKANSRPSLTSNSSASNSHSLELQIQELVVKIMEGQGLPWPKPAYLKRLAGQERSRVMVLRILEEKLGIREPGEMVMATSEQIIAVGVSKAVFKGVLDLLKYLIVSIEEELQKEPEPSTFSIFLILRIAFSTYLPPKPHKTTIGISLLNALNLSSFVTPQPPSSPSSSPASSPSTAVTTGVTGGGEDPPSTTSSPDTTKRLLKELSSDLPTISISDTDEETEELHFLHMMKRRNRRSSSPLLTGKAMSSLRKLAKTRNSNSLDLSPAPEGRVRPDAVVSAGIRKIVESCEEVWSSGSPAPPKSDARDGNFEMRDIEGCGDGRGQEKEDGEVRVHSPHSSSQGMEPPQLPGLLEGRTLGDGDAPQPPILHSTPRHSPPIPHSTPPISHSTPPISHSTPPISHSTPPISHSTPPISHSTPPISHSTPPISDSTPPISHSTPPISHSTPPISHSTPPISHSTPPISHSTPPISHSTPSISHSTPPISHSTSPISHSTPPISHSTPPISHSTSPHTPPISHSLHPLKQPHPPPLSPLEASVPPSPVPLSPDETTMRAAQTPHEKKRRPPNQPILLSELVNSPRFYHPREGQVLAGCCFLYKELMKALGNSRNFLLSRHLWNQVFISTLTVDRDRLGWNECTVSLYEKYSSLNEADREAFSFEEDSLLSILLHNLLVFMLAVGLSPQETTGMIHRFSARTRLAITEEKLLQQTLKHIEQCIEDDNSDKVDINLLGLMALYSEVHPTVSYIIHYGMDVLAPVYKLQITDEVLILRRFPDDKICCRLWNDCISIVRYNKAHATVSVYHKDPSSPSREYYHHFHTKQYMKVYESLQELVSPGRVESGGRAWSEGSSELSFSVSP